MSKDAVLELKVRRIASKGNDKEMFEIYSKILEDYDAMMPDLMSMETIIYSYKKDYAQNPRVWTILDNLYEDLFEEIEQ